MCWCFYKKRKHYSSSFYFFFFIIFFSSFFFVILLLLLFLFILLVLLLLFFRLLPPPPPSLLVGDSPSRGYSVYVGMDLEAGGLLAVYEWNLHTSRSYLSKRRKQVLSIQQEFESLTSQGLHHPRLLQHLEMTISPFEADCRIYVEVQ